MCIFPKNGVGLVPKVVGAQTRQLHPQKLTRYAWFCIRYILSFIAESALSPLSGMKPLTRWPTPNTHVSLYYSTVLPHDKIVLSRLLTGLGMWVEPSLADAGYAVLLMEK